MRFLTAVSVSLILVGCGKKEAATQAGSADPSTPPAVNIPKAPVSTEIRATPADVTATLNRLTQTLRKFAAEHRRVPASFDELVAFGYLPELPGAPPGKRYVFDNQLRVTLKDAK